MNLDATELGYLQDGFSSITIGDATNGTGAVDVNASTFNDNITIVGGPIAVTQLNAGANAVTLTARTGAITDGGDVGTDVTGGAVTLNAISGTIGASGDGISVNGTGLTTNTSTSNGAQEIIDAATGDLVLTSLNAGSGTITLASGTFALTTDAVANGSDVTLGTNVTLNVNGATDTLDELKAGSMSVITGTGSITARVSTTNATAQVNTNGASLSLGNAGSTTGFDWAGDITVGIGHQLTLNDSNAALLGHSTAVNGTLVAANGLLVRNGDTLSGSGTVNAAVTLAAGAILSPGTSPGKLQTGNLTFGAGGFDSFTSVSVGRMDPD